MFGWFKKKRYTDRLEEEIKHSFNSVKEDFDKVGKWISHFDDKAKNHKEDIEELKKQLFTIQNEIEELKDFVSLFGTKISKQQQPLLNKQHALLPAQKVVQTAVQTSILDSLSLMERAIVWALINSNEKMSYEDLSVMLGKDKSTIRGQINAIKQKSESLISETKEQTGKKRLYIDEEIKQILMKSAKVRVKTNKKSQKKEEKE